MAQETNGTLDLSVLDPSSLWTIISGPRPGHLWQPLSGCGNGIGLSQVCGSTGCSHHK